MLILFDKLTDYAADSLPLNPLAKELYMSKYYLIRKCKKNLIRIEPNRSIGEHIHETQLETHEVIAGRGACVNDNMTIPYEPGILSVFPAYVPHEVNTGEDGLYLFAKFMPALC